MPIRNLYLHIGMHKTGSSSIQHGLVQNSEVLKKHDYYYPMEGTYYWPHEHSVAPLAYGALNIRPEYIGNRVINHEVCVSDIRRDIKATKCSNVIVSTEHFWYAKTQEDVKKIFEIFADLFETMTVILYLRRQDFSIESHWSQWAKMGLTTSSFDEYCDENITDPIFNYYDSISHWIKIFGKDNVVITPFEERQFFRNNLIDDFCKKLNLKIEIEFPASINKSPPKDYLELQRAFFKSIHTIDERRKFSQIFASLPIKVYRTNYTMLSAEKRAYILDFFRKSNERVAREYLDRADGVLFFESEKSDVPVYPGMSLERFSVLTGKLILELARNNAKLKAKID